jgi:hypothetical protein
MVRTYLKVNVDVEAGNAAIADGSMGAILENLLRHVEPEALYFTDEDGERTIHLFFDLADPSLIPVLAEPLFSRLAARCTFKPAMNLEDLQKGLGQLAAGEVSD